MVVTEEDINRVVKKPSDLEETIDQLQKQKEYLQAQCRKAGKAILELDKENKNLTKRAQAAEGELTIIKGIGNTSPEMRTLQKEVEELKAELARSKEDHQYDNLVHQKELKSLRKT
jgi:chromosome segregation ATPase